MNEKMSYKEALKSKIKKDLELTNIEKDFKNLQSIVDKSNFKIPLKDDLKIQKQDIDKKVNGLDKDIAVLNQNKDFLLQNISSKNIEKSTLMYEFLQKNNTVQRNPFKKLFGIKKDFKEVKGRDINELKMKVDEIYSQKISTKRNEKDTLINESAFIQNNIDLREKTNKILDLKIERGNSISSFENKENDIKKVIESVIDLDVNKIKKLLKSKNIDVKDVLEFLVEFIKDLTTNKQSFLKNREDKDIIILKERVEEIAIDKGINLDLNNNGIVDKFETDMNKNSINDKLEAFNENQKNQLQSGTLFRIEDSKNEYKIYSVRDDNKVYFEDVSNSDKQFTSSVEEIESKIKKGEYVLIDGKGKDISKTLDQNKNGIDDRLEYFNENLKINAGKKLDTAVLPISDFEKIGISKTELFNKFSKKEFSELLSGNKTNLFALDLIDKDLKFKVDVKLSLKENPDKTFSLRVHPFRKEIENTYKLSSKELESLKLGKTIEKDFQAKGSEKSEKHIFQLDKELNEIVKLKSKDLDKKLDLNLSAEQKEAVTSGKTISIKSKDKNHIIKLDLNKSNGLNLDIKELSKDLKMDKGMAKEMDF